jgi:hypothetical protein
MKVQPGNAPVIMRRQRGFGRSDLLAVLAVISVLGALLLGSMTALRQKAQFSVCHGNLHDVNRAILLFAGDHEDRLPWQDPSLPGDLWWWFKEKVKPYGKPSNPSEPTDKTFACPCDRGYSDPRPFCQTARFDYGSYVFNGVTLPGVPSIAGWRVPAVHEPGKTLLAMEWTAHAPLSWHRSRTGRANAPFYSDAKSMLGFVDGHVSFSGIYYDGYNAAYTRDPIPGYDYKFSGR